MSHGIFLYSFRKLPKPGNVWQKSIWMKTLGGHSLKLCRWSLDCTGTPQDVGNTRGIVYLPTRSDDRDWNQPKRRKHVTGAKLEMNNHLSSFGIGLDHIRVGICLPVTWSCFDPVFSHYVTILLFQKSNSVPLQNTIYNAIYNVGGVWLGYFFLTGVSIKIVLGFWLWTFNEKWDSKRNIGTLEIRTHIFALWYTHDTVWGPSSRMW